MIRIALPNKGALSEEALRLAVEAGYGCRRRDKQLMVVDAENDVEFLFLRPRDIAVYVSTGIIDVGLTGRDLALDSGSHFKELLGLGFGRSRFCYAVPKGSGLNPAEFGGLRIATSYANLVAMDLRERHLEATVVKLDGAVEISVRLGVADAVADVVESGRTLRQAGLEVVGEPVLLSEAVVIARAGIDPLEEPEISRFLDRLRGILVAREYVMVEYDIPREMLQRACEITPGIEAPTVAPLSDPNWVAVKAMQRRREVNRAMDQLSELGAKGILVSDIRTCRL